MLHARPIHKVHKHHKSWLVIDYWDRDNPLKFSATSFSRVGRGLEGCFSQQSMGNKDLINIWALWVGKLCNFTPRKTLKLLIERTNIQWLLETLVGFRVNVVVDYAILTFPYRRNVKRGLVHIHVNHMGSSSWALPLGWHLGWTDDDFPVWFLWLSLRHHPNFEEIRSERMTHKDEYALADILASLSVGQQP